MENKIIFFGQDPEGNDKTKYELFVKAIGAEKEILLIKDLLEKKLFQTELKDGGLIGKFTEEYWYM